MRVDDSSVFGAAVDQGSSPAAAVSRRRFLAHLGWTTALATLGGVRFPTAAAAHDEVGAALPVWAAVRHRGELLGLGHDGVASGVFRLTEDAAGTLTLADRWSAPFPDVLAPRALVSAAGRLYVAGGELVEVARLTVDNRSETVAPADRVDLPPGDPMPDAIIEVPATSSRGVVHEVSHDRLATVSGAVGLDAPYAEAVAVVAQTPFRWSVLLETSTDVESAYNDVLQVADTTDAGASWVATTVAEGLGEGGHGVLAETGGTQLALVVDQAGRTWARQRPARPNAPWSEAAAPAGVTPIAVASGATPVVYGEGDDGRVRRLVRARSGDWDLDPTFGSEGDIADVVVVSGEANRVIEVGASRAQLRPA